MDSQTPTSSASATSSPSSETEPKRSTNLDQGGWDSLPGESEAEVDYTPAQTATRYKGEVGYAPGVSVSNQILERTLSNPTKYLEVEIMVSTPDGRRFTFRQEVEYEPEDEFELEDAGSLLERVYESTTSTL